ncbi:hypothetical protein, partial [Corallococcus exiguus]
EEALVDRATIAAHFQVPQVLSGPRLLRRSLEGVQEAMAEPRQSEVALAVVPFSYRSPGR